MTCRMILCCQTLSLVVSTKPDRGRMDDGVAAHAATAAATATPVLPVDPGKWSTELQGVRAIGIRQSGLAG